MTDEPKAPFRSVLQLAPFVNGDNTYTVDYGGGWKATYSTRERTSSNGAHFRVDIRKNHKTVLAFIRMRGTFDTHVGVSQGPDSTNLWHQKAGVPIHIMMEVFLTMFDDERYDK